MTSAQLDGQVGADAVAHDASSRRPGVVAELAVRGVLKKLQKDAHQLEWFLHLPQVGVGAPPCGGLGELQTSLSSGGTTASTFHRAVEQQGINMMGNTLCFITKSGLILRRPWAPVTMGRSDSQCDSLTTSI